MKYSLPTPVPASYKAVKNGTFISVSKQTGLLNDKPIFLHFFNPDCPCSRFNITHFRSLVKKYGTQIHFGIVVMEKNRDYSAEEIQDKFDVKVPVFFDESIAKTCGVYSTPQAAIINTDGTLYYKGNYNSSRYCSDVATNYAQFAIDSLLNHHSAMFSRAALISYGCELPNCTK